MARKKPGRDLPPQRVAADFKDDEGIKA